MSSEDRKSQLETMIARIFCDPSSMRYLIRQTGLSDINYNFGATPIAIARQVLDDAINQGKVGALLTHIKKEYPGNAFFKTFSVDDPAFQKTEKPSTNVGSNGEAQQVLKLIRSLQGQSEETILTQVQQRIDSFKSGATR